MTRVAVIGVGRMGARMSRRLMAAGHAVTVCDPSSPAVQELCSAGAARANSSMP